MLFKKWNKYRKLPSPSITRTMNTRVRYIQRTRNGQNQNRFVSLSFLVDFRVCAYDFSLRRLFGGVSIVPLYAHYHFTLISCVAVCAPSLFHFKFKLNGKHFFFVVRSDSAHKRRLTYCQFNFSCFSQILSLSSCCDNVSSRTEKKSALQSNVRAKKRTKKSRCRRERNVSHRIHWNGERECACVCSVEESMRVVSVWRNLIRKWTASGCSVRANKAKERSEFALFCWKFFAVRVLVFFDRLRQWENKWNILYKYIFFHPFFACTQYCLRRNTHWQTLFSVLAAFLFRTMVVVSWASRVFFRRFSATLFYRHQRNDDDDDISTHN